MPIIRTNKNYFDEEINKEEITLLQLLEFEDFDRSFGKLEMIQYKLDILSFIISDFLEQTPEGVSYIKKYVERSCISNISYEDSIQ